MQVLTLKKMDRNDRGNVGYLLQWKLYFLEELYGSDAWVLTLSKLQFSVMPISFIKVKIYVIHFD